MNIEIKDLKVDVLDKTIIDGLNLKINAGEIHAIMGPNGTGKSTLSKTIMGYPDTFIKSGDILVNDKSILNMDITDRSKLGIFLVYQNPITIEGLTNSEVIKSSLDARVHKSLYEFVLELEKNVDTLNMSRDMLHRDFNVGFSGGEKKKNEILQVLMLKPKFIILDELDSGLDVDSLKIVCLNLNKYLQKNPDTSVLIITHYTRVLEYIKPDFVHKMNNGTIVESGDYSLAKEIEKNGYQSFSITEE